MVATQMSADKQTSQHLAAANKKNTRHVAARGEENVLRTLHPQYLLLPADGAVLGDPLQAAAIHGAVPLDLLHLLQGEGDGYAWHRQLRPADVVLQTPRERQRRVCHNFHMAEIFKENSAEVRVGLSIPSLTGSAGSQECGLKH